MTLDQHFRLWMSFEIAREAVERKIGSGFQGRGGGIEQHITERHDGSALGLPGFEVRELLLRLRELLLRNLSLLRLRLDFLFAAAEQDLVALLLSLCQILPRGRCAYARLSRLGVALCEISKVIDGG